LESLLFYRTSDLKNQLDHLIVEELAPIDKINKLIALYINRINKNKGIYRIIHFEFNSEKRAKSLAAFAELKKGNLKTLETIIAEGQKKGVFRKDIIVPLLTPTILGTFFHFQMNKPFFEEVLQLKTKETFEKIRVKSNFDSIIENISSLIQQSKKIYLRPKICAWTVVQKDNIHEFEEIFYLSNQIGFDELSYQFHISDWGKQEWHNINKDKLIDINQKKTFINNMIYKKEFKTKVNIFTENILTSKKKCKWPVRSSYIDNQGYVSPCCIIGDSKVINFGNINKTSYSKIWKSTEYIQFRKSINENKIPSFCKNCYR
jgi:radical SAM protein with 4Fe4S-binding SPASM domain